MSQIALSRPEYHPCRRLRRHPERGRGSGHKPAEISTIVSEISTGGRREVSGSGGEEVFTSLIRKEIKKLACTLLSLTSLSQWDSSYGLVETWSVLTDNIPGTGTSGRA